MGLSKGGRSIEGMRRAGDGDGEGGGVASDVDRVGMVLCAGRKGNDHICCLRA